MTIVFCMRQIGEDLAGLHQPIGLLQLPQLHVAQTEQVVRVELCVSKGGGLDWAFTPVMALPLLIERDAELLVQNIAETDALPAQDARGPHGIE